MIDREVFGVNEAKRRDIEIVCPKCLGALCVDDRKTVCRSCHSEFGVKDQIPVLRQNNDTYYGEFPQDEMHELIDRSRDDLEGAIRSYLRKRDAPARLGEYILGRGRAGWQYLLPIDGDSTVLDLGCGWGTLAWGLAQFCGQVVACDITIERMQLLGIRRHLEAIENLQLVCAGDCEYLPFLDDSFSAVVVNDVLEWVPSGLPGDPREVQTKFLREVRRVLKPDGCLFMGIENRYAWKTWGMNPDGHTGLRFVPWLPRKIADVYSRVHGRGGYRNYLYGPGQYRTLLSNCGFSDSQFYVPCPGYHHPLQMIDFNNKAEIRETFTRPEKTTYRKFRQAVKGRLSASFPDAFGIVASDQNRPSYLSRLIAHVRKKIGYESVRADRFTYRMNGEMGVVTVISREASGSFVLKLPIHNRGLDELRAEAAILGSVRDPNHPLHGHAHQFAKVLDSGEFEGQNYFIHSLLQGVSGDKVPIASDAFLNTIASIADFLAALHVASPDQGASLEQLVDSVREAVLSLASTRNQIDTANRVADTVIAEFGSSNKSSVWSHGDSKLANFMVDKESGVLMGVIDWGTGFRPELPCYDLSFLFVSSDAKQSGTSISDELRRQHQNGLPEHHVGTLQQFLSHTGESLEARQYQAMVGYQWLKRLAPLADGYETMRFNHRYLDSMFEAMR